MSAAIDWWSSLKHGGLLIAPDKVVSDFPVEPGPLPLWQAERLRRALTAFDGSNDRLNALLDFISARLVGLARRGMAEGAGRRGRLEPAQLHGCIDQAPPPLAGAARRSVAGVRARRRRVPTVAAADCGVGRHANFSSRDRRVAAPEAAACWRWSPTAASGAGRAYAGQDYDELGASGTSTSAFRGGTPLGPRVTA